ncbi:MAG: hypothetical protein O7C39_08995 [Bacteroidetes bacterium]|nr:hypothetical protein [Bacteroidota bacterium]
MLRGTSAWLTCCGESLLLSSLARAATDTEVSSPKIFLGLFPTHRWDELQRARNLPQGTIQLQFEREFVPVGAFMTLSKLHFLVGDSAESLDAMRELVNLNQE